MVRNTTRRTFVKNGIGLAAGVGALASAGTAAAASGAVIVEAPDTGSDDSYYFEIWFDDNSGMSITTESGSIEWHDWDYQGDQVALKGIIAKGGEITLGYDGTTAEEGDATHDDVDVSIY